MYLSGIYLDIWLLVADTSLDVPPPFQVLISDNDSAQGHTNFYATIVVVDATNVTAAINADANSTSDAIDSGKKGGMLLI